MSTQALDYKERYKQAHAAYCEGNLDQANEIINQMSREYPNDANILLLQGHINVSLQNCGMAREYYQAVLSIADRSELRDYALQGLAQVKQIETTKNEANSLQSSDEFITTQAEDWAPPQFTEEESADFNNWSGDLATNSWGAPSDIDWDSGIFNDDDAGEPTLGTAKSQRNLINQDQQESLFSDPQFNNNTGSFGESPVFDGFKADLPTKQPPSDVVARREERNFVSATAADEDIEFIPADMGETSTFIVSSDLTEESTNSFPKIEETINEFTFEAEETGEDSFLKHLDSLDQNELENISKFDITDISKGLPESDLFGRPSSELSSEALMMTQGVTSTMSGSITDYRGDTTSIPLSAASSPATWIKPSPEVNQGNFAWFKNAPLKQKQWVIAAAAGVAPMLMALLVTVVSTVTAPKKEAPRPGATVTTIRNDRNNLSFSNPQVLWLILGVGVAGFGITYAVTQIVASQAKKAIDDLQNQLNSISEGEFNVKAKIYSEDELGQLAARFNQVSRVILTATREAQRRAEETESSKNELHRQVIRLLDDVEGAARGDLTVEAEVTADVLGAVADAFNLTIQNLREIVRQVKKASKQVNKASTDSESYARNQSSDAHRMAEELAVTLNSVQLMTESIQRVAESARQAEEVARTSSMTALRGGEAVERTVAGILQIRETVSETARKVKRLAEASQEISKIVAVISQIASRTNLLALNASIQAAKAGEAGRGFAIVADEVRQLADRSAKSLKEIQQIVLQIQSETGLVMTAMEEGIQQVLDVTDKSELAKNALDDIIQVSNRIDSLVRSITGDTVRQRENSRNVAQVVQAVELTAQETSQESQRVAGALLNLVSISQDLLVSVERFRIDVNESQV